MRLIPLGILLSTGLTMAMLLTGCGSSPSSGDEASNQQPGRLVSTVVLGKVGALGKSGAINLSKLIITGISTTTPPDTVRDTSAVTGNSQVTVSRTFTLKPLRNWILTAKTLDIKDSLIHTGSTSAFFVKPADTVEVSLNLTSRFAMYEARFNSLPDSISSGVVGTGKDAVKIKRVVLKVDGAIRADSSVTTSYAGGQTVVIYYDYISPGAHTALLEAYGTLNTFNGLLYSGTSSINVSAGADDTKSITLSWQGPTTGTSKINVTLGKVGKVTINGALPGSIIL
jgi:hypothetical protein